ncbi:hypothetical protein [Catenulispora pinisilvae]|uniref:hypothetical protein n=1 Tax=Catenulispora pinisilvae TaxID=2705253 RepID=UPI00189199A5|nr:hypothetical protein [Catenulispora pinisilvae]
MRNLIGAKRLVPGAFAAGVVLVIGAIAVPLICARDGRNAGNKPAIPASPPSPAVAPSGAISLVQGARTAAGIQVGFPHTTVGAVSAASEYVDAAASTLDPDYAASVMRVAGDPGNTALPSNLATSIGKLRAALQLRPAGPLDPPVTFQTTAQMYQLRNVAADDVLVLLLTDSTFINAQGGTAQTTGVFPVQMRWIAGDWKIGAVGHTGQDYSALVATPDTQAAASHGWLALVGTPGGAS